MVIHPNDDTLSKLKVGGQVLRQGAAMFPGGKRRQGYRVSLPYLLRGAAERQGNGWKQNTRGASVLSTSGGSYSAGKNLLYSSGVYGRVPQGTKGLRFAATLPAQRKEIQDHPLPQGIIVLEPR